MSQATLVENPVFRTYCFYAGILVLKTLAMSILTAIQRVKNKAFANPEDAVTVSPKLKPRVDDNVERVRRAHLNDLENITMFLFISFIYTLTNPSPYLASILFLAFTVARILHTVVYAIVVLPQPARGLSFGVGLVITAYMAVASIMHFCVL